MDGWKGGRLQWSGLKRQENKVMCYATVNLPREKRSQIEFGKRRYIKLLDRHNDAIVLM